MDAADYWRRLATLAGLGAAEQIQQMLSSMSGEQISACISHGAALLGELNAEDFLPSAKGRKPARKTNHSRP